MTPLDAIAWIAVIGVAAIIVAVLGLMVTILRMLWKETS